MSRAYELFDPSCSFMEIDEWGKETLDIRFASLCISKKLSDFFGVEAKEDDYLSSEWIDALDLTDDRIAQFLDDGNIFTIEIVRNVFGIYSKGDPSMREAMLIYLEAIKAKKHLHEKRD